MCGFLLCNQNAIENIEYFISALRMQSHRGPDSEQFTNVSDYIIGFNRLSIIDPYDRSMQPVTYKDKTMVMNGELYNFKELKSELSGRGYNFNTNGDAEVFICLIHELGIKQALQKARGMYALALYSSETQKLTLARDRLGIKPLYYSITDKNHIIAASEVRTVRFISDQFCKIPSINEDEVVKYLHLGSMHESENTFFNNIKSLPAGSYITYDKDDLKSNMRSIQYYTLPKLVENRTSSINFSNAKSEILKTFELHAQSDVPIGLALSGGIDSSILASYYSEKYSFNSYSLLFPGLNPENHIIDETVKLLSLNHKYVDVREYETIETIAKLIEHIGQPFRASQTIYQYALREAAANDGIKVFLTGDGADEVFAGYSYAVPYALADKLSKHEKQEAEQLAQSMEEFTARTAEDLLNTAEKIVSTGLIEGSPLMLGITSFRARDYCNRSFDEQFTYSLSDFLSHRLLKNPIPYWLAVEDSISMMASIESRVPYLDHKLINESWKLDKNQFISHSVTKYPLRYLMEEFIPIHVSRGKKKYQRPGRDAYLVYKLFVNKIRIMLEEGDPLNVLDTKACLKEFDRDTELYNAKKAGLWFRVFTYLVWASSL